MRLRSCWVVIAVALLCLPAMAQVPYYENDFTTLPGAEWNKRGRATAPSGEIFLGRFGGESVRLEMEELPAHCSVTVSFDLYVIGSWDGSTGAHSPDVWELTVMDVGECCPLGQLFHTTFANCACRFQSYPDAFPSALNRGFTGADQVDTLGYGLDSVYSLSATFFHQGDDLIFDFGATPLLQDITDEAWGLDNVVVELHDSCCRATRALPEMFGGGHPMTVELAVDPGPLAEVWTLEETPPAGWSFLGASDAGVWDATTGTLRWGPFYGEPARTVTYTVVPPPGAGSDAMFSGATSVDGVTEMVCGDDTIASGGTHAADLDDDSVIDADELTAYGAAWRRGDAWPRVPDPITAEWVTNAGLLWRAGGGYRFHPAVWPPFAPLGGVPAGHGAARASLRPGAQLEVTIEAAPADGTLSWAVEDAPPAGWTVAGISHGGVLDEHRHLVKWGPFFDDVPRTLTYTVVPSAEADGETFAGIATFDGVATPVSGVRALARAVRHAPTATE